jgi:trimeric autotransporter adhesin
VLQDVAGFEANNRIRHNTFNNQNYYAIFTYLQRNHEIIGNVIDMGATTDVNSFGVYMVYIDSFKLERNNIKRFGYYGIYGQILNFQFGSGSATSTIINNMIGGLNSSSNANGIYINPGSTRNINIYHNSVSINSTQFGIYLSQSSLNQYENIDIKNNSFANFGTGQAAYMYFGTGTPYSVNYNNYFSNGSTFYTLQTSSFNASQPNGLAPTYNANSKNGDPIYINSMNNLHSIATQLNDAGDNSVGVSTDIDGDSRPISPSTTVDIGADEYNIPQFDAGIIAIQSPLGICPGGSGPSNVIVTVGNQGTATLTSATVNWSVNGTVQTPFNWTGSLVQNASQANINIGSYTFALSDILKVWTSDPNGNTDQFTFNDTQSNVMNNQLTGTYTIGGSTPDYPNFTAAATALSTLGVCGPVTFNVRQGTYNEKVQINTILGSSATNFVTFRPDPANTNPVVLTTAGNTNDNNNHTLFLNGASFVQFRNMTITNTSSSSWKSVIRLAGMQDSVVFKNNIITTAASTSSGQNEAVINGASSTFNMLNRFVLDSNIINNGSAGIYLIGGNIASAANFEAKNRISHNTFNNQHYYGVFVQFQRNTELIGNFIDMGALTNTNSMGMYLQDLDTFKIEKNNIRRFGYYGIFTSGIMNHQFGTGSSVSTIVNNMIGGQNINSNAVGIYMNSGNTRNVNIYHNSISINSSQYGIYLQTTTPGQYNNVSVRNNSFANFGSGVAASINYLSYTPFDVNYNNYFSAGTNLLTMGW